MLNLTLSSYPELRGLPRAEQKRRWREAYVKSWRSLETGLACLVFLCGLAVVLFVTRDMPPSATRSLLRYGSSPIIAFFVMAVLNRAIRRNLRAP